MKQSEYTIWQIDQADGWDVLIRKGDFADTEYLHQLALHLPISSFPHFRYESSEEFKQLGDSGFVDFFQPMYYSERAINVLGDMLIRSGQLCPIETSAGAYTLFHCTRFRDVLDLSSSVVEYDKLAQLRGKAGILHQVHKFVFYPDQLENLDVFVLPNFPSTAIYCADRFKRKYEEAELHGLEFRRLWPLEAVVYKKPRRLR